MMPSLPKRASSVKGTAEHFFEQNTDKRSVALENQQAGDSALVVNGSCNTHEISWNDNSFFIIFIFSLLSLF
jgi:hypothetical protein